MIKKKILGLVLLSLLLGIPFIMKENISSARAEALPLRDISFTNSQIAEKVACKMDDGQSVNVDINTYKYFALDFEISPKEENKYVAYNVSLINGSNADVVSLKLDATKYSACIDYPEGLSVTDYAGATGGGRKGTDKRLNLPTTEKQYFIAQKSTVYYLTIKTGFKGTVFLYLPDYTNTNFEVSGIMFANNDSTKTTIIRNAYFCENIEKLTNSGFQATGNRINFKPTQCVAVYGNPVIRTPLSIEEGKGIHSESSGNSELIVSFKDQINVSLETYKYLAIDMTITSAKDNYLNANLCIYDNHFETVNNLKLDRTKMEHIKESPYPYGFTNDDYELAIGKTRCDLLNPTPVDNSRVSYITNKPGTYVPVKAANAYYFVFVGGDRYVTYIYLPDFEVNNFNLNGLGLSTVGASMFSLNEVYLCERVTKIYSLDKSTYTYKPTGNLQKMPIINAQSYGSSITQIDCDIDNRIYYHVTTDTAIENGNVMCNIFDSGTSQTVEIIPTPNEGYKVKKVCLDEDEISLTNDGYVAPLTKNGIVYVEFKFSYTAVANYITSQGTVNITYNSDETEVTFEVKANFGYRVETVLLNGEETSLDDGKLTTLNNKNNELTVLFKEMITIRDIENGIIEYTLNEADGTVTFLVTSADGYTLENFVINDEKVSLENNTYTTQLDKDLIVDAKFKKNSSDDPIPDPTPTKNNTVNPMLITGIALASAGALLAVGGVIVIIRRKKKHHE